VLRFEHISIEKDCPQSSVRVIFQDSRGFLWFGTEDGLNRYDGYTFKTFKPEPSNPNSLSDWLDNRHCTKTRMATYGLARVSAD
jgi:ligand-binding sensor domain-containing protein